MISGRQINVSALASSVMSTRLATACYHTSVPLLPHKSPGLGGRLQSLPLLGPLLPSAELGARARGGGPAAGSPVVGTFCGHCDGTEGGMLGAAPSRTVSAGGLGPGGFVSWTPAPHVTDPPPLHSASCGPRPPTLSTLFPEPCMPLCHPLSWHPCKVVPQGLPGWQSTPTSWRQPGASLWQDSTRLRQQEPGFTNHRHTWLYFSSL